MRTKTIILDGGPMDGELVYVRESDTEFICFTSPPLNFVDELQGKPIPIPLPHTYKEDPGVPGHFIYVQESK